MNLNDYEHLVIVDLEATCTNSDEFPRHEREIIEIGAAMVERESLHLVGAFTKFVKPVIHPVLTDFCTELTSIEQVMVDIADDFPTVLESFNEWMQKYKDRGDVLFCSWGAYDKNQMRRDCEFHGVPYPFGDKHLNIKTKFSYAQGRRKQYGLAKAMRIAQIPQTGTHHRGIDDALNMAKLMPYIVGDKKVP